MNAPKDVKKELPELDQPWNLWEILDYVSKNDEINIQKFKSHKKKDDLADALLQILIHLKSTKKL